MPSARDIAHLRETVARSFGDTYTNKRRNGSAGIYQGDYVTVATGQPCRIDIPGRHPQYQEWQMPYGAAMPQTQADLRLMWAGWNADLMTGDAVFVDVRDAAGETTGSTQEYKIGRASCRERV